MTENGEQHQLFLLYQILACKPLEHGWQKNIIADGHTDNASFGFVYFLLSNLICINPTSYPASPCDSQSQEEEEVEETNNNNNYNNDYGVVTIWSLSSWIWKKSWWRDEYATRFVGSADGDSFDEEKDFDPSVVVAMMVLIDDNHVMEIMMMLAINRTILINYIS